MPFPGLDSPRKRNKLEEQHIDNYQELLKTKNEKSGKEPYMLS